MFLPHKCHRGYGEHPSLARGLLLYSGALPGESILAGVPQPQDGSSGALGN